MKSVPGRMDTPPENDVKSGAPLVRGHRLRSWQVWLGILFSVFFLALAIHGVDLGETLAALGRVNGLILISALISFMLSVFAKALRWRFLLGVRKPPAFGRVLSILCVGLMVNAFLPTRLGEFSRAYLMGEAESDNKVYILGTIAVEKIADLFSLLVLLAVLLLQMTLPEWLSGPARGTAMLIAILVPSLVVLVWQKDFILRMVKWMSHFFPVKWQDWMVRQTRYGLESLDMMRRPRLLLGLFGWSLIVWVISALTNYLVFISMQLFLPVWTSLLLLAVLQVGTAVPSSPGSLGIFQYLVILTLSIFSIDKDIAFGYSIVLYLVIFVPIALAGIWGLWHEKVTWARLTQATVRLSEGRRSG